MEIKINGQTADVTIDSEKTVGEVMAGLEQWLANSGHRLSGLAIDGQTINASSMEEAFSRDIDAVKVLDLHTSPLAELAVMSLLHLLDDIEEYENLGFEEKKIFHENWKQKPQALFAAEQMPDLFSLCGKTFSGGVSCEVLRSVTEERLREIKEPVVEFTALRPLLDEICARLIDLPLDIQTGKEGRAAQTIQIFSGIAEKILRVILQLDIQGYMPRVLKTETLEKPVLEKPVLQQINEFGTAVKELLEAYEKNDSVLIGDMAEYEMAPKLMELYNIMVKNCCETADAQGMK